MRRYTNGIAYFTMVAALFLSPPTEPAHGAEIAVTWTGDGSNVLYSNSENWSVGAVPINGGGAFYHAIIPSGFSVDFDLPGAPELSRFSAGPDSTFTMLTGSQLSVLGETLLNGRLVGASGVFSAPPAPLTQSTSGSATFSVVSGSHLTVPIGTYRATASYRENWDGSRYHHELMRSSGSGSLLDFSTVETIDAGYDDSSNNANAYEIIADDGGAIDLSNLTYISNPLGAEDCLRFVLAGGSINLSALETINRSIAEPGYTEFDIGPNSTLAFDSLRTAGHAHFTVRNSTTGLALPVLENYTGGTVTLHPETSLTAGALTAMDGVTIDFLGSGSVAAPILTRFTNGAIELDGSRTFATAGLSSIDDSRITVSGGRAFGASTGDVTAQSYAATVPYRENWEGNRYHHELLRATGSESLLDLSTVERINAGYDDGSTNANMYEIIAEDGGTIDLSSLTTLDLPVRQEDYLAFIQRSGGTVDLSNLRYLRNSGNGKVLFQIESGGLLRFGDAVDTQGAEFILADPSARLAIDGSLLLEASAMLSASSAAEVAVTRDFFFKTAEEDRLVMDEAVLHIQGIGPQRIEIGGEDAGVSGFTGGNFGIGRLVLGEIGSPTSASLLDLYNNGNRGETGAESLYLYGLGGTEGLVLEGGSILTLDNLNVYAWNTAEGAMQHLNALFEPGEMRIPFDNGYLQLARMDTQWTNAAGGAFRDGTNWDGKLAPAGSDAAVWNAGSTEGYTVSFTSNAASDSATVKNDTVTFDLGGYEYALGGFNTSFALVVGPTALDRGNLTIENGSVHARNAMVGDGGALTVASTGELILDEDLVLSEGTAVLRVLAGGCTRVGGSLYLGKNRLVDLDGGSIVVGAGTKATQSNTLVVHETASVFGTGTIGGSFVNSGTIAPAADGSIHVSGDLTLADTSQLELVYSSNGQPKPTFEVAGAATLDGRLRLSFPAETAPDLGAEFVVMEFNSASGGFDAVDGIYPYADSGMRLVYGETRLSLIVTLRGDFNGDGTVNSQDLDIVRANWGTTVGAGDWGSGDGSGDGKVGSSDLDLVRANWGTAAARAVPEPAAGGLMLWLLLGTVFRRRFQVRKSG